MANILVVLNSSHLSGAEYSTIAQMNCLRNQHHFFPVTPLNSNLSSHLTSCGYKPFEYKMQRFRRHRSIWEYLSHIVQTITFAFNIKFLVRRLNIDIIWAHSTQSMLYVLLLRLLFSKKIIWHVRDNTTKGVLTNALTWAATDIVCISSFIYKQLPASSKTVQIYNGLDTLLWMSARQAQGGAERVLKIGHIGQLVPWKRHNDLIEIFKQVVQVNKKVHLYIAGEDLFNENQDYVAALKRSVLDNNLNNYMTFTGYQKDIKSFMDGLDVVLHTAVNEPLGRVLLEAMALEKVIIAYDSGGISEIVDSGIDGFLAPERQVSNLTQCVFALLSQDDAYREMIGRAARRKVISRFDIAVVSNQLDLLFEQDMPS